jgi:predicted nucleic acid-binding protein
VSRCRAQGEIRFGLDRNPTAHAVRTVMEEFLLTIRVLGWGRPEAMAYSELRAALKADGNSEQS